MTRVLTSGHIAVPELTVQPPGVLRYQVLYGSHAHGTAVPESDEDWRGVYQLPTNDFLGLHPPKTTFEAKPDAVYWELGHFCRLLLAGNPNIVGMLWTPGETVFADSTVMAWLRDYRYLLISTRMRDAYLGWAKSELRAASRADIGGKRLAHVPRLLWELYRAVEHGVLLVRPPESDISMLVAIRTGTMPYEDAYRFADATYHRVERAVATAKLGEPPADAVESILLRARHGEFG